ncbi:MAG: hypothetical protein Q4A82_03645, partial [Corynebacterium sp.]|nr:hypothetical protein [Corynebacterium sp.]
LSAGGVVVPSADSVEDSDVVDASCATADGTKVKPLATRAAEVKLAMESLTAFPLVKFFFMFI